MINHRCEMRVGSTCAGLYRTKLHMLHDRLLVLPRRLQPIPGLRMLNAVYGFRHTHQSVKETVSSLTP